MPILRGFSIADKGPHLLEGERIASLDGRTTRHAMQHLVQQLLRRTSTGRSQPLERLFQEALRRGSSRQGRLRPHEHGRSPERLHVEAG